jgi:glucosamine-6-phosphate deaminase
MKTSWEKVTVDGSPMGMYLAQPEGTGPFPAIVVIQNQDGVKEFTQEMTRRVAAAGYVGIAPQSPGSFHAYMQAHLFGHVDMEAGQARIPDGMAGDIAAEAARYEA